jgi:hypothetical protein
VVRKFQREVPPGLRRFQTPPEPGEIRRDPKYGMDRFADRAAAEDGLIASPPSGG